MLFRINTEDLLTRKERLIRTAPGDSASSSLWIAWYKELEKELGREGATIVWSKQWELNQSAAANDEALRKFMSTKNVVIDIDTMEKIGSFFTDPFGLVSITSSTVKAATYVLGAIAAVVLVIVFRILWKLSDDPLGNANKIVSMRTGGL
jgi:hypothetical protein